MKQDVAAEITVTHETFTIERSYRASPGRVFEAWRDPAIKQKWFAKGEGWDNDSYNLDFQIGGRERSGFRMKDGPDVLYEAEIDKQSIGAHLDARSQFKSASEADQFLLGISFGAQWEPEAGQIKLLAETHDPWQTYVGRCKTSRHALLTMTCGVCYAPHVTTQQEAR